MQKYILKYILYGGSQQQLEFDQIFIENEKIISEIRDNYDISSIHIIGKGPSAKYIKDKFAIGINEALIFTNYEFVLMNDLQSFFGIEHLISNIKYIFVPYYIHVYHRPDENFTYKDTLKYLDKHNFKGKVFVYFMTSSIPFLKKKNIINYNRYFFIDEYSAGTAVKIFNRFFNKAVIHIYGVNNGSGYHPIIAKICNDLYIQNNNKYPQNEYYKFYSFYKNYYTSNKHLYYSNDNVKDKTAKKINMFGVELIKH